jgi:peptide/nickel transport system ATP-binding protein
MLEVADGALRHWRGDRVAMVSQDPGAALNPSVRVGKQVAEAFRVHEKTSRASAVERARHALERVALHDAGRLMARYPHELSGGQQQRVLIAMALAGDPELLILDEPTTGLDATVEAEVMDLVAGLRAALGTAIVFISHNVGLVARVCDRVGVLYAGRLVEEGPARALLTSARHPYTASLLRCLPRRGSTKYHEPIAPIPGALPALGEELAGCTFAPRCALATDCCRDAEPALEYLGAGHMTRCIHHDQLHRLPRPVPLSPPRSTVTDADVVLEVRGLHKRYGTTVACDDVDLVIHAGETVGLIGESGSGKSTLARCIAGLTQPDSGSIQYRGRPLPGRLEDRPMSVLQALQMVFQSPDATLNPRHTVRSILQRAIVKLRGDAGVEELAATVHIDPSHLDQRPARLSGGQRQRVAIARAFARTPELVLCDEPLSALDASVQAGILALLSSLQRTENVSYLFISHDLGVVRYLADTIAVMYRGTIVETGAASAIFAGPQHPYTEVLISSAPDLEADPSDRIPTAPRGEMAPAGTGCVFSARCPRSLGRLCTDVVPPWHGFGGDHLIRCHLDAAQLASATV